MFVTHLRYRGYVVYSDSLQEARTAPLVAGTSSFMIWLTPEQKEPGIELADWAWEMELKEARFKRVLIEQA